MPVDFKDLILQTTVAFGTESEWEWLYETALTTESYEEKIRIIRALTHSPHEHLLLR